MVKGGHGHCMVSDLLLFLAFQNIGWCLPSGESDGVSSSHCILPFSHSCNYKIVIEHVCVLGTVLMLWLKGHIQNSTGTLGGHVLRTITTTKGQDDNRAQSGDVGSIAELQQQGEAGVPGGHV